MKPAQVEQLIKDCQVENNWIRPNVTEGPTIEQMAEEWARDNHSNDWGTLMCPTSGAVAAFLAGAEAARAKFISVDKELPKDTRKLLLVITAKLDYRTALWMNDPIEAGYGFIAADVDGFQIIEDVIGWMPLPEYEGGE